MTDPIAIAAGLSAAQRRVLLHGFGVREAVQTLYALRRKGLMVALISVPVNGGWQPTPLGLLVRQALKEMGDA